MFLVNPYLSQTSHPQPVTVCPTDSLVDGAAEGAAMPATATVTCRGGWIHGVVGKIVGKIWETIGNYRKSSGK